MGLCTSSDTASTKAYSPSASTEELKSLQRHREKLQRQQQHKKPPTTMGIGLGVAMMMQQAAQLSGAPQQHIGMDLAHLQNEMRKAKAEGRTVTVINGCVYFDYQLVAQLPPNYDLTLTY